MSIEAMKQALDALEGSRVLKADYLTLEGYGHAQYLHNAAITALRQAIAQAEKQEPVAYVDSKTIEWFLKPERGDEAFSVPTLTKKPSDYCDVPLYTAPPSKPWVSLTDEEIGECIKKADYNQGQYKRTPYWAHFATAIEAALKSKNNG